MSERENFSGNESEFQISVTFFFVRFTFSS